MSEVIYPAICGTFEVHDTHSWREGFFWHRKVTCPGSVRFPKDFVPPSAALIPMQIILPEEEHKHHYRLVSAFHFGPKNDDDLAWYCECKNYFIAERGLWWRGGVNYDVRL
jgi:hypothetical protein